MDIGTLAGLVLAVVAVLVGILLGGGSPAALIDIPSFVVVFGGTSGAILCAFPLAKVLKIHEVVLQSVFGNPADPGEIIRDMVKYAEVARREGILSLENLIAEMKDPFVIRGVKMAVDGTDPELIKTIMETELDALIERHAVGK
ncbi:MAG: motility protein A, partial [Planctomycetota bacterium]